MTGVDGLVFAVLLGQLTTDRIFHENNGPPEPRRPCYNGPPNSAQ